MILRTGLFDFSCEQTHVALDHMHASGFCCATHKRAVHALGIRVNPLRPADKLATIALKRQRTQVLPSSNITRSL